MHPPQACQCSGWRSLRQHPARAAQSFEQASLEHFLGPRSSFEQTVACSKAASGAAPSLPTRELQLEQQPSSGGRGLDRLLAVEDAWSDCQDLAEEDLLEYLTDFAELQARTEQRRDPSQSVFTENQGCSPANSLLACSFSDGFASGELRSIEAAPREKAAEKSSGSFEMIGHGWAQSSSSGSRLDEERSSVHTMSTTASHSSSIDGRSSFLLPSSGSLVADSVRSLPRGWDSRKPLTRAVQHHDLLEHRQEQLQLRGWGPSRTSSTRSMQSDFSQGLVAPPCSPAGSRCGSAQGLENEVEPKYYATRRPMPAAMAAMAALSEGRHSFDETDSEEWSLTSLVSGLWPLSVKGHET
eukprot:TRINITY_DN93592_c0_g1_i1.p1 TRINITY_DN93592_c0_g1~~TRINITY_DN93592_c0_g1_i1.p1  ORF type:complete len:355 (+),score=57.44 TRINITY_DN93592_c0_g1_i1:65-1129(+)